VSTECRTAGSPPPRSRSWQWCLAWHPACTCAHTCTIQKSMSIHARAQRDTEYGQSSPLQPRSGSWQHRAIHNGWPGPVYTPHITYLMIPAVRIVVRRTISTVLASPACTSLQSTHNAHYSCIGLAQEWVIRRIGIIRRAVFNAYFTVLNKLGCIIRLQNLPSFAGFRPF
jgi:hypothetical protein